MRLKQMKSNLKRGSKRSFFMRLNSTIEETVQVFPHFSVVRFNKVTQCNGRANFILYDEQYSQFKYHLKTLLDR